MRQMLDHAGDIGVVDVERNGDLRQQTDSSVIDSVHVEEHISVWPCHHEVMEDDVHQTEDFGLQRVVLVRSDVEDRRVVDDFEKVYFLFQTP